MFKQVALYITISVAVSCGIGGYGAGYYMASRQEAEDTAAIRAILEKQEAEKERAKEEYEKYLKGKEEIYKRWDRESKKSH